MTNEASARRKVVLLLLAIILVGGAAVLLRLPRFDVTSTDIYFTYLEGQRLLELENPYARVLSGNMQENNKYATYFPLFYLLGALTQAIGLSDYGPWISFWRIVFLACTLGSAGVIFWILYTRRAILAAAFAAIFFLLSRWTLHITQIGGLDSIALLPLLLALLLFDKHRNTALLLFGCSLAFKQIAIFLVPLFLIWTWQSDSHRPARSLLIGAIAIAAVPLLLSVPFLVWNAEGFVKSIVFSVTRNADAHINAPAVGSLLGLTGVPARAPMILLLALVYLLAWRQTVGRYIASLLTMAVFIDFNAVLFLQYFGWLVPFVPLSVADYLDARGQMPALDLRSTHEDYP